jgi:hypothetical protein
MLYMKVGSNLPVNNPIVTGDKIWYSYGVETKEDGFKGIRFTTGDIHPTLEAAVWDLIPERYRKHFNISLMHINRTILPHTDSDVTTVINIYVNAGDYITGFNRPIAGAPCMKLPEQTDGLTWLFGDTQEVCSFVAQDGDAYVLDVTHPHSVYLKPRPFDFPHRLCVNLSTRLTFDEVVLLCDQHKIEKTLC